MNAPFQSVGIVFFVTMVHVVVIAMYSSQSTSGTTIQKSIDVPSADAVEVVPEQLIENTLVEEPQPEEVTRHPLGAVDMEKSKIETPPVSVEEESDVVTHEAPEPESQPVIVRKPVEVATVPEVAKERWNDSAYSERVSFPILDGILGRKSKKLAETKPEQSAPTLKVKETSPNPAPRARVFSPIPKS